MNVMNEMFQMMQTASTSTPRQTPKADTKEQASSNQSEFDKLLHGQPEKSEPAVEKPTDGNQAITKPDETQDDVLQEIAAAMSIMANTVTLPRIQTQEPLPTQQIQSTDAVLLSQEIQQPVTESTQKESFAENTGSVNNLAQAKNLAADNMGSMSQRENMTSSAQLESQPLVKQQSGQETSGSTQTIQPKTAEHPAQPEADWKRDDGNPQTVQAGEQPTEQPLFETVKSTPVKVGDTPIVDTNSKNLETQLAKQIGVGLQNGAQQVKIQLTPENLGTVTIELTRMQDGAMEVVLHTTTEKAANLLSQHTNALGAILQNNTQGTVQVEVQRQEQNQQFQQNQQHHEQNPQQQSQKRQHDEDFLQQLRLGLVSSEDQAG